MEGMSDGWDAPKAYGYNDVFDDPDMRWSRYSHSMRVSVINRCATISGSFAAVLLGAAVADEACMC